MGRKKGIFAIENMTVNTSVKKPTIAKKDSITIQKAFTIVVQQMRVSGNRERTISDYTYIFEQFVKTNNLVYVEDITTDTIYNYLDSLKVSNQTKLIRLKSIKAVLGKFYDNGWFTNHFWSFIQIKIDKHVKKGVKESDIEILLALLDKNTFIGFRDSVAILTLFKTGVRIRTLGEIRERHIDFENLF